MIDAVPVRSPAVGLPIAILGIPLDNLSTKQAIDLIEAMVASREPHYLVTANVDFLVQAQEDEELRRILIDAHLVLCDGTPLVWASRFLGNPLPERVAGADLVPLLIRVAAQKRYRIFFLGATPAAADTAVANLQKEHPELIIAGHYSPPFNHLLEMDHDEISRRILAAAPDLLFVSLGCPKQEKWVAMHYRSLGVPVSVGVGATIDFLAGHVKRAPLWMQRTGVEWIFRLLQEPRRLFRRYVKDVQVFGGKILAQWWRLQFCPRRRRPNPTNAASQHGEGWRWIKSPERLDIAAVRSDALAIDQLLADGRHCLLDMSDVYFVDSTGVGLLIRLHKKARAAGRQLVLLTPSVAVQRVLRLMQLQDFFASSPNLRSARQLIEARIREQAAFVTLRTAAAVNPLVWQGEITAANTQQVWEMTRSHIRSTPRRELVIDLSAVRFMDSSGVGVMVRAKKFAQTQGAALSFTNAPPAVRNVLRLARLEDFLLSAAAATSREHVIV
jgi:N-acetylglucosaminyldiphosphoundecaprenol N-acetyl-beta-D-mannosaminyltransferase